MKDNKQIKKEDIIKILAELNDEVHYKYKARLEGIFGTLREVKRTAFVRGEEKDKSDVDVLVSFEENANLLDLVGLSLFLEEKLHRPVDVVPSDSIRREIKDRVLREAIYLWETPNSI